MSDEEHRYRPAIVATSAVLTAALGPPSEWASEVTDPAVWVMDLAVGWTFVACGLIAAQRRPGSGLGPLMLAIGGAWFLPNFGSVQVGVPAWLAHHALYLYRGPLIHLLVTFPTGRPTSPLSRTAVALGYLSALGWVWAEDRIAVPLAVLLLTMAVVDRRRLRGPIRRARLVGVEALGLTTLALAGGSVARLLVADDQVLTATRWIAEVVLCLVPVWLLVSLLTARWERATVTDLVVEMSTAPSDRLRDDLARALGDPGLEIAYWMPSRAAWVDFTGRALNLPEEDSGRAVTRVDGADGPLAALVHNPAVLDDQGLLADVQAAAGLAAANAKLQAQVRDRVVELTRSRRRLLEAADEERQRLEQRLYDGTRRRLEILAQTVASARSGPRGPETAARLALVDAELNETLTDLTLLGRGLHPRELGDLGFAGALRALAVRSPLRATVTVEDDASTPPDAVAAAAYYVCSEALANSGKHARAAAVRIEVTTSDGHLTVEVADEGEGGADSAGGSGLRGLIDRVETLGGSLTITSPPGVGTRLTARIPLAAGPD